MQGTVRTFSGTYGFITPDDGDRRDEFVHFTGIRGRGFRSLEEGQRVEFDIEDTERGPQAVDVVVCD